MYIYISIESSTRGIQINFWGFNSRIAPDFKKYYYNSIYCHKDMKRFSVFIKTSEKFCFGARQSLTIRKLMKNSLSGVERE